MFEEEHRQPDGEEEGEGEVLDDGTDEGTAEGSAIHSELFKPKRVYESLAANLVIIII